MKGGAFGVGNQQNLPRQSHRLIENQSPLVQPVQQLVTGILMRKGRGICIHRKTSAAQGYHCELVGTLLFYSCFILTGKQFNLYSTMTLSEVRMVQNAA